jgi:hypothetical protein
MRMEEGLEFASECRGRGRRGTSSALLVLRLRFAEPIPTFQLIVLPNEPNFSSIGAVYRCSRFPVLFGHYWPHFLQLWTRFRARAIGLSGLGCRTISRRKGRPPPSGYS